MQLATMVMNGLHVMQARMFLAKVDVESILSGAESADTSGFEEVNNKIAATGAGFNLVLGTIAVFIFLIVGGTTFLKGFVMGTPAERSEFKQGMLFKVLMIIGFFALAGMIVIFANMGSNLF